MKQKSSHALAILLLLTHKRWKINMAKLSVLIFLSVLISVEGIVSQQSESDEVQQWKTTFRKNYTSAAEELKAMKNLKRNMKEIEIHNIRFKAGLETYSRGLWELSDLSFEEKTQLLAGSHVNFSQVTLQGPRKRLRQGPTQVNWVERGRVHEVQNQAKCGSCFAFAAVAVAEGVLLKNGDKTRLSVQQIVDCDKLNEGCEGLSTRRKNNFRLIYRFLIARW
jgi:C1A family cysteine protease